MSQLNLDTIYIARLIVEAATPLRVSSGEEGLLKISLVAKDANDLPYIPGTSLAGVLRHEMETATALGLETVKQLFGYQEEGQEEDANKGLGSRIIFTSANLLASDGKTVHEGLDLVESQEQYYQELKRLPERDHVRINHKGVAEDTGKYEEELVLKGTRFVFEVELHGTETDREDWEQLLDFMHQDCFRVGAGTRKGFGQLEVVECKVKTFQLNDGDDLTAYLNKSSSLNASLEDWQPYETTGKKTNRYMHYQLQLQPELFFLFGAGIGDEHVNALPKTERYFKWEDGKPTLTEEQLLIPATSIKGALSHRVAFYYNDLKGVTIESANDVDMEQLGLEFDVEEVLAAFDFEAGLNNLGKPESSRSTVWEKMEERIQELSIDDLPAWQEFREAVKVQSGKASKETVVQHVGELNEAVRQLFGYAKNDEEGARGKVIFSDAYLKYSEEENSKVLNHVKIDRFTGGGVGGALFSERVTHSKEVVLDIFVEVEALKDDDIRAVFEAALTDLTTGRLQLGGHTTKGHGAFSGEWRIKSNKQ